MVPLSHRDLLPVRAPCRAARDCYSAATGLATGRSLGSSPDGRVFRLEWARADRPSTGASLGVGVFHADLGRPARDLVAAGTSVATGRVWRGSGDIGRTDDRSAVGASQRS